MSDLLWPGDDRAGGLISDAAVVRAMVAVEGAWLSALVATRIAPPGATADLTTIVTGADAGGLGAASEAGGNPVIPLVHLLRERIGATNRTAAHWLHRGLTSQDVLDTALVLCLREAFTRLRLEHSTQVAALTDLASSHRGTLMPGRTLTQHAVPITFGLKATTWLTGLLDAAEDADAVAVRLPAQLGGAAGSLAGPADLARLSGAGDPARAASELTERVATALGLLAAPPWHTARAPLTRAGDALVRCTDAYGRIANDVLTLARPEIAELAEPPGRGGSSTMPQKRNPVLSVLIRRAALAAPALGSQLHLAAADTGDERAAGAWQVEWPTLRLLARRAVVAASQTTELLTGLRVDAGRMAAAVQAAAPGLLAEARSLADAAGAPHLAAGDAERYLGASDLLLEAALERAAAYLKGTS